MYFMMYCPKCIEKERRQKEATARQGLTWYLILFRLWNGLVLTANQHLDRRSEYSKQRLSPSLCPCNKYCMGQASRKLKTLINDHINSIDQKCSLHFLLPADKTDLLKDIGLYGFHNHGITGRIGQKKQQQKIESIASHGISWNRPLPK